MLLWNTKITARFLGLSPRTLERMRVNGGGPMFVKLGTAVRYQASEVEAWVESNSAKSTSAIGTTREHLKRL